jgi:hypothetical protein
VLNKVITGTTLPLPYQVDSVSPQSMKKKKKKKNLQHQMKLLHVHILVSLEYRVVFQTSPVPQEPPIPDKLDEHSHQRDDHPE